jgi:hypothetical protein
MDERAHTHEIQIAATSEEVWEAIANPDEIRKWFEEVAELEPKENGAFRYAGEEPASRIEIWEPPHRFKVVGPPTPPLGGGGSPEAASQSFDYVIEARGASCTLRMTHSGIPADASWDAYYDGTSNGWDTVLQVMRHIVEEKVGGDIKRLTVFGSTELRIDEIWARAFGADGIIAKLADVPAGTRFDVRTSLGDEWSGKVLHRRVPGTDALNAGTLTFTVDQLGGAVLAVAAEPMLESRRVFATHITFDSTYTESVERYRKLLEESFELQPLGA